MSHFSHPALSATVLTVELLLCTLKGCGRVVAVPTISYPPRLSSLSQFSQHFSEDGDISPVCLSLSSPLGISKLYLIRRADQQLHVAVAPALHEEHSRATMTLSGKPTKAESGEQQLQ